MKARGPFGWPKGTLAQALGGTGGTDAASAWAALAQLASQAEARAGTDATKAITPARLADRLPVSSTQFLRLQQSATSGLLEYTGPDGFKNLAGRNGGLEVWQRGAGGSASISVAASTTAYTADGWSLVTGANQASTVSQQAGLTAGSRWCARVQRNNAQTGTGAMTFEMPLDTDEIVPMRSSVVTLSLTLRSGANWSPTSGNITVTLYTGTGSPAKRSAGSYTGEATPIASTQAISTTATRLTFTTAALGASIAQASIVIGWTPTGTAGAADYFEIDDVQIEVSPVATPFERRPFEAELRACERHYEKSYNYATAPGTATSVGACAAVAYIAGTTDWMDLRFKVRKRATPTMTLYSDASGATGNIRVVGVGDLAATTPNPGEHGAYVNATTAAAATLHAHYAADAGI